MNFYESIASQYDLIFPPNPTQAEFVNKCIALKSGTLLDIGCGTGNLTFLLQENFEQVSGLDFDQEMLDYAIEKRQEKTQPEFTQMDMLKIAEKYAPASIDNIVCFGNTLVHLNGLEEINAFILAAKKVLKPGGKLLVQTINYDRILNQEIKSLPTIKRESIEFVRNYNFLPAINRIEFETILSNSDTKQEIKNNIKLYPLLKAEIHNILLEAGFEDIQFYGNFKLAPVTADSQPLIFSATR